MKHPNLNRKLVLQSPESIPDGAGGFVNGWITLGELWADIRPRTGSDRNQAGAPVSSVNYVILVRSAPAGAAARPKPQQRFLCGPRIFNIRAIADHDAALRYLACYADEEAVA